MASSSSSGNSTPQAAPSAAKKGFLRRILPALLAANVAVGVYVFLRTWKKEPNEKDQKDGRTTDEVPFAPAEIANVTVLEHSKPAETSVPINILPPIPEQEQRELLKWMLEEKRKIKPQNASEKKKIDEEKALLKEFIRAKSIPSL